MKSGRIRLYGITLPTLYTGWGIRVSFSCNTKRWLKLSKSKGSDLIELGMYPRLLPSQTNTFFRLTCLEHYSINNRATAFFAQSDNMALGVRKAILNEVLRIPENVALMGVDDINMASAEGVDLTTISQKNTKWAFWA